MSSDNGKKVSQLPPRERMEEAKLRQAANIAVEVLITVNMQGQLVTSRPECNTLAEYAGIADLLATSLLGLAQEMNNKLPGQGFAAEFINLASTVKRLSMKQAGVMEETPRIVKAPAGAIPPLRG